jgi:hypothetical protein
MRKIVESTFVTLDGVISDPQTYGPPYWDEEHLGYGTGLMESTEACCSAASRTRASPRRGRHARATPTPTR